MRATATDHKERGIGGTGPVVEKSHVVKRRESDWFSTSIMKLRVSEMRIQPLAPLSPIRNTFSIPPVGISVQPPPLYAQFLIKMMHNPSGSIDNSANQLL